VAAAGLHATFNNIGPILRDRDGDGDDGRSCFMGIDNKLRANFRKSMKPLISLRLQAFPQHRLRQTGSLSTR